MIAAAPTALVTGANRGLGLETALQLGERGYRVILTSREAAAGCAAAADLARDGIAVETRKLDVTNAADIAALAEGFRAEGRSIDLLVTTPASPSTASTPRWSKRPSPPISTAP